MVTMLYTPFLLLYHWLRGNSDILQAIKSPKFLGLYYNGSYTSMELVEKLTLSGG